MISCSQGVYEIGHIDSAILSCIGLAESSCSHDLIIALLQNGFIIDLIATIPGQSNDRIRILFQHPFGLHWGQGVL